jgi:hypothetical protein
MPIIATLSLIPVAIVNPLKDWSIGVLENWSVGGTVVQVLLVQYSITPIFLTPPLLLRI